MRFFIALLFISHIATAQFAPPQGQAGSTAMYKDSSAFTAWANSCSITRGLQNISNTSSGYASVGDSISPVGMADGTVVSLGDGGYAICSFQNEIYNGPGNDFAVFENSFDGNYLELAFVEVSSDGVNFLRFPANSNTQDTTQTGGFGNTDATKLNNLAGKYIAQYGTPFDLDDMQGISGLDINQITHVKIIDVVGSLTAPYATYDKNNNKVNDPWPTPYSSSGFDLDAVGIINQKIMGINKVIGTEYQVAIYPNPAKETLNIDISMSNENNVQCTLYNDLGGEIKNLTLNTQHSTLDISMLTNGVYFLQVKNNSSCITKKICISK